MAQIIASDDLGDVKITTYCGNAGYETFVMDLKRQDGKPFRSGVYQWDKIKALEGHKAALSIYGKPKEFGMKISLKTLMSAMYDHIIQSYAIIGDANDDPEILT